MDASLLEILCCPSTHQPLKPADTTTLTRIGGATVEGTVFAPNALFHDESSTNIEGDIMELDEAAF